MGTHRGVGAGFVSVSIGEQLITIDGVSQLNQSAASTVYERERCFDRIRFISAGKTAGDGLLSKMHDLVELATATDTTLDDFSIRPSGKRQFT